MTKGEENGEAEPGQARGHWKIADVSWSTPSAVSAPKSAWPEKTPPSCRASNNVLSTGSSGSQA